MKKVMVVDDNPDLIFSIKEAFYNDYEIISAESGKQCLKILETKIPDIIILDIMMPDMSGWETFNKIREKDLLKNIPIVFLTARRDDASRKAGVFLGDDYIEKPFELNDLKKRIDKLLK